MIYLQRINARSFIRNKRTQSISQISGAKLQPTLKSIMFIKLIQQQIGDISLDDIGLPLASSPEVIPKPVGLDRLSALPINLANTDTD